MQFTKYIPSFFATGSLTAYKIVTLALGQFHPGSKLSLVRQLCLACPVKYYPSINETVFH